jgi:undecaprenyl-diphosphatase
VAAFLPAAVLGVLFDEKIERHLFGLWPVAAAWLVGGVAILALTRGERGRRVGIELECLDLGRALVIGLLQCVAMWPGTSRSLMTIAAGLLCGLTVAAAVEFSFLLGVVTLTAATAYKVVTVGTGMLAAYGTTNLVLGSVAAALSAAFAVRWMVSYLQRHSLSVFGWYRALLGLLVAALLAAGVITPT